jgi:hypothetical protein
MEMQLVYRSCYQGNLICHNIVGENIDIVTYSGSIHDGTLMHSKTQYTTLDYSSQLL